MSNLKAITKNNFRDEVLASNVPVVVDFYASWCGPCRALAPILEQVATHYAGKLNVVKVNIDEEPELAEHFQVSGVPMLVFFNGGRAVDQIVGLPAPQMLLNKINALTHPAPAYRRVR